MFVPVWTLSPSFRSDILTEFPFSILTFAKLGKQGPLPPPDGGGGGAVKESNNVNF